MLIDDNTFRYGLTDNKEVINYVDTHSFYSFTKEELLKIKLSPILSGYYFNLNGIFNPLFSLERNLFYFFQEDEVYLPVISRFNKELSEIYHLINEIDDEYFFYNFFGGCNLFEIRDIISFFMDLSLEEVIDFIFTESDPEVWEDYPDMDQEDFYELLTPLSEKIQQFKSGVYQEYLDLENTPDFEEKIWDYEFTRGIDYHLVDYEDFIL